MRRKGLSLMKRNDIFLCLGVLLACGAAILLPFLFRKSGQTAIVSIDGHLYGEYSLSTAQTIEIDGGKNILIIENGSISMKHADCPDKLCLSQGKISLAGQSIICLPNRVAVEISGEPINMPDVIVG